MENINGDEQSENIYAYNNDISNQQSKESNSIKRSKNEEDDNPYKISQGNQIIKNEEQNVEQNTFLRSIGDKNLMASDLKILSYKLSINFFTTSGNNYINCIIF